LIAGLLGGDLCTTATDDFTVHKDVKLWGNTIQTVCGGHNGIETRLPVAFTKFVVERHMLLPRFAAITSTNAARILGLYPQKGVIAPGSDADLVLIDPRVTKTLALADDIADPFGQRRGHAFERLVEQQEPRAAGNRARERDDLLLASAELGRAALGQWAKLRDDVVGGLQAGGRVLGPGRPHREQDVVLHGQI